MSNFFINSSEILTISLLNNKSFYFNQEELARNIGCTQPNVSYVISSLIDKGIVENIKGFIMVNQYRIVECLTDYAESVFNAEIYFSDRILKITNWFPEIFAFFQTYLRIFNIEYVITECKALNEICFVFKADVIDISDID
jgi:hypothetical protein